MKNDQTDYILQTQRLTKIFKGFTAVDAVDLNVKRGDIHALIGPNGAGKTTVFNLLTKFLPTTSGNILFNGNDITAMKPAAIANEGIIRSFQISAVFPRLTVLENVRLALQKKEKGNFYFWKSEKQLNSLNPKVRELLSLIGLEEFQDSLAMDLPYGRKRALEIATTLAIDPILMLLDEPTQGMGQEDVKVVSELIKRVSKNRTILMVEHNLSVVAELADHITVLQRGAVLKEGNYEEVSNDDDVREAYMGVEAT